MFESQQLGEVGTYYAVKVDSVCLPYSLFYDGSTIFWEFFWELQHLPLHRAIALMLNIETMENHTWQIPHQLRNKIVSQFLLLPLPVFLKTTNPQRIPAKAPRPDRPVDPGLPELGEPKPDVWRILGSSQKTHGFGGRENPNVWGNSHREKLEKVWVVFFFNFLDQFFAYIRCNCAGFVPPNSGSPQSFLS